MSNIPRDWSLTDRALSKVASKRAQLGVTIGPALAWLGLFVLVPLGFLVLVSFTTTNEQFEIVWQPTLVNYENLLIREGLPVWDTPFVRSLVISYEIAAAATLATLLLSFPVAYLLARRSGLFVRVTLFFLLVPFFSVYIVRMYAWFAIFGSGGAANNVLLSLGLIDEPLSVFGFGVFPTVVAITHAFVPYMLLTLYASLDGVDFSLVEAARDLGAGRVRAFTDIVLPLVGSGVIAGSSFVFIPSLGAYLAPELLGRGQFIMIGQLIVTRIYTQYSIGYGSAIAMFIVIAVLATFVVVYRLSGIEGIVKL